MSVSGAPQEAINVYNAGVGTGGHQHPPQSAQDLASFGASNGSGTIFSMYLGMATEEDKKMAENWKADADGMLIFTGLFSAVVASLISVSIQDIRPNPQDTANFYLANIYRTASDTNKSNNPLPSSPPPFSPPTYAIWVNSLWFLSLVISVSCALLATLLQQWARRYLRVTQPRYSLHKRARIRTFFAEGVERILLLWAVEALPMLLHISLFLFFGGLSVFLYNVTDLTTSKLVLSWVALCTALYGFVTIVPIFRHDSPYHTPLSLPVWHIVTGISFVTFQGLRRLADSGFIGCIDHHRFRDSERRYSRFLKQGMRKTAEETALNLPSEIDARAFLWTLNLLDEDDERERFFSGLPGFRYSKVVDNPLPSLTEEENKKLSETMIGFLDRTNSSDSLPEFLKKRRATICAKAIDPTNTPGALKILEIILSRYKEDIPLITEILRTVRGWGNRAGEDIVLLIEATVMKTLASASRRNDSWFILASNELGVQEPVLRDYATHGEDLSLAVLIHIVGQQLRYLRKSTWPRNELRIHLGRASRFDAQNTSPGLQHEFCALWNRVALKGQNTNDWMIAGYILKQIRRVYVTLHQGTDSAPILFSPLTPDQTSILLWAFSYPLCHVPGHHPVLTPHIHDDSSSTTIAHTVLRDNASPPHAPLTNLDAPSSSVLAPHYVSESPTDVSPLDNDIHVSGPFHLAPQTTAIEHLHIPPTSQPEEPVTAHVVPGNIDASITTTLPTQEPSPSTLPASMAPISPPGAAAVQQVVDHCTPSDVLEVLSPPSPTPVLYNILPTEPYSPLQAPASPGWVLPQLSSAPDLGAAAREVGQEEGSAKAALQKALGSPSTIRENTTAGLDLPPQSPSTSPTEVAIAGPSWRSLSAEHTGDGPPHPSHSQNL